MICRINRNFFEGRKKKGQDDDDVQD